MDAPLKTSSSKKSSDSHKKKQPSRPVQTTPDVSASSAPTPNNSPPGERKKKRTKFIEMEGDEKVKVMNHKFEDIPEVVIQKAVKEGIDVQSLSRTDFSYLVHILWFLYRDKFPSGWVCYERLTEKRPFVPVSTQEQAKKQIKTFDGTSMKKLFPTLDFCAEGGFGTVFTGKMKCDKKGPKKRVAVKKLSHTKESDIESNICELYFLTSIKHKNVVDFLGCYISNSDAKSKVKEDQLMFVMEWLEGGTLQEAAKNGAKFEDHQIAFIARESLLGIQYLHSKQWVHRDLKSQNIMLSIQGDVKLIDFGLAADISLGRRCKMLGSPMWIPPEMIKCRPHGYPADIWSLGVGLLELYLNDPPLRKKGILCMLTVATKGLASFIPENASKNAKAFLEACLTFDPDKRPSATELLEHPWLKQQDLGAGITVLLKQIFLAKNLSHLGI